jgi:hypothetical protein
MWAKVAKAPPGIKKLEENRVPMNKNLDLKYFLNGTL